MIGYPTWVEDLDALDKYYENVSHLHETDVLGAPGFACKSASFPRGRGTSYNGLYGEAPPERGTFFTLQVYERVEISRVQVYERVGKSVIYVFKRAFHQNISNTHTL